MTHQVCVLGAGAGFAGDRVDPAVVLARAGVDAVVLECLAERTLVPAIRARRDNPQAGYDPRLVRRLTPLLPVAREKVVASSPTWARPIRWLRPSASPGWHASWVCLA